MRFGCRGKPTQYSTDLVLQLTVFGERSHRAQRLTVLSDDGGLFKDWE
jgi:hypothetical protein